MTIAYIVAARDREGRRFLFETTLDINAADPDCVINDIVSGEYERLPIEAVYRLDFAASEIEDVTVTIAESVRDRLFDTQVPITQNTRTWINRVLSEGFSP